MNKAKSLVILTSSLFIVVLYSPIGYTSSSAKPVVKEDTKQYVKSSTITADIKARLLADADIQSIHISVHTVNDIVTLTGYVESEAQKMKTYAIARETNGVKSIDNKIVVKPPKTK